MRFTVVGLLMLGAGAGAGAANGNGNGATTLPSPWPKLGEVATAQLNTAVDGSRPDEPALYPLLLHMRTWTRDDVRVASAFIDRSPVASQPWAVPVGAVARGHVYAVEGRFAGRVRDIELLRGGPWGKTITEWGIVADGPKDAGGRVAIVYFPGEVVRPRDRQRVRVVARFYKRWTDVDAAGVEATYPVFVAAPFWEPVGGEREGAGWRVMVVLVLGLTAGLWGVRRVLRQSEKRKAQSANRRPAVEDVGDQGFEDVALPEDPAEALGVLRERGESISDS